MNVCFVSPYVYPLFDQNSKVGHGGAEMDLYLIGTALVKKPGYQVSFVVGDFGQSSNQTFLNIKLWKSFRTDYHGFSKLLYAIFLVVPKLLLALRRAKADIYVQEGAAFETGVVAIFCWLHKRKFVYRVASTVECDDRFIQLFPLVGRVFRWALHQADAIVTEDQEEVELLKKHYSLTSQAIYDTTPLPDEANILPIDQRHHMLWVSRLVPMKRPEHFIELAREFPNERFILIAPIDEQQKDFADQIISLAKHQPNVELIPGLPHQQLDAYYQKAKLFINTSDFEGYPNTFIEAGKYAVPILSLRVNPDALLTNDRFGSCAEGSNQKLKELLQMWIDDAGRRERTGMALSKYIRATSDINKNILQYEKLFIDLITETQ